jgi:hypothetical protein
MDRGFIWALQKEGYSKKDIDSVLSFQKKLTKNMVDKKQEKACDRIAKKAWSNKKHWGGYIIVRHKTLADIRQRISLFIASEIKKPTPVIIYEPKRGVIYVQESTFAKELFNNFGGFTFGLDQNWGYQNNKKNAYVALENVKDFLLKQ